MKSRDTYKLREWTRRTIPDRRLSPAARRLAEELSDDSSRHLQIDELRDGIRIRTFAHVGVVNLGDFTVQIEPKMVDGAEGLTALIDYASGIDHLERFPEMWDSFPAGSHLLDLYALLFVESCEELLKRGLRSGYVQREAALEAVRGRILVRKQMVDGFGRADRVECRFDERDRDVWENRLLAAALKACRHLVSNARLRARIRRVLEIFEARCRPGELDLRGLETRRHYHRMNAHYRDPHELALLLLEALGLDEPYRFGNTSVYAFLLDMNRLFERFVGRLLEDSLASSTSTVLHQPRRPGAIVDTATGESHTAIRPDFLIRRGGDETVGIPIDAKYKRYADRKVSTADIYQLATYAQTFGRDGVDSPSAVLVFPAGEAHRQRLAVKAPDGQTTAEVLVWGLDMKRIFRVLRDGAAEADDSPGSGTRVRELVGLGGIIRPGVAFDR